jgi:hypothetical protein
VHDEREVVHQNPLRPVVAFDVRRPNLPGLQRFLDRVGNRVHLPRVLPRAQEEEIGECRRMPKIEHDDIVCLLVERRANGLCNIAGQPAMNRVEGFPASGSTTLFSLRHATDLPFSGPRVGGHLHIQSVLLNMPFHRRR